MFFLCSKFHSLAPLGACEDLFRGSIFTAVCLGRNFDSPEPTFRLPSCRSATSPVSPFRRSVGPFSAKNPISAAAALTEASGASGVERRRAAPSSLPSIYASKVRRGTSAMFAVQYGNALPPLPRVHQQRLCIRPLGDRVGNILFCVTNFHFNTEAEWAPTRV